MLIEELKIMMVELETLLNKDVRFKKETNFKTKVSKIYKCNDEMKLYPTASYDITPLMLSNLTLLKPKRIIDNKPVVITNDCDCNINKLVEKLILEVKNAHNISSGIGSTLIDKTILLQIDALVKQGKFDEAFKLLPP